MALMRRGSMQGSSIQLRSPVNGWSPAILCDRASPASDPLMPRRMMPGSHLLTCAEGGMTSGTPSVVRKIENDLVYRLPHSRKPLSHIILTRDQAEELLKEIYELRIQAGEPK